MTIQHRMGSTPTLECTFFQEDGVTPLDITNTTNELLVTRPDGSTVAWALSLANGANGRADYVVDVADFNMPRSWHFQGRAVGGGKTWYSDSLHRDILPVTVVTP